MLEVVPSTTYWQRGESTHSVTQCSQLWPLCSLPYLSIELGGLPSLQGSDLTPLQEEAVHGQIRRPGAIPATSKPCQGPGSSLLPMAQRTSWLSQKISKPWVSSHWRSHSPTWVQFEPQPACAFPFVCLLLVFHVHPFRGSWVVMWEGVGILNPNIYK